MKKDFWSWHERKSKIDNLQKLPYFFEREIWFCYLGVNIGSEQDGGFKDFLRPMLILKKFNTEIFWGIPLTKTRKNDGPYYYSFSFLTGVRSTAVLSQIRLIDGRRLSRKMGVINEENFKIIIEKLKALFP